MMYLLTKVSREKALASEEEKKVQVINADVAKKQKACQEDLAKAEPALIAAKNALGTLNKVTGLVCLGGMDYIYYKTRSSATAEKQRVSYPHGGGARPASPLPRRPLWLHLYASGRIRYPQQTYCRPLSAL